MLLSLWLVPRPVRHDCRSNILQQYPANVVKSLQQTDLKTMPTFLLYYDSCKAGESTLKSEASFDEMCFLNIWGRGRLYFSTYVSMLKPINVSLKLLSIFYVCNWIIDKRKTLKVVIFRAEIQKTEWTFNTKYNPYSPLLQNISSRIIFPPCRNKLGQKRKNTTIKKPVRIRLL